VRLVWSSARKDIARQLRDPSALVLALALPIVVGGLMVAAFGGEDGPPPKARVLVADEDDSFVSGLLLQSLGRVEVIEVQRAPRAEARARIDAGDASAMLVIPAGFGDAVLDDRPTTLQLVTNPAQRVLPGIVEQTLRILVDGAFYARRLLGEPLREVRGGPPAGQPFPDETVARISVSINQLMTRVRPYLLPPVIALEVKEADAGRPRRSNSLGLVFFPGMLLMGLLFTTQGQSADVWRELQQGTLRRALTTPAGIVPLLGGKVLAGTLVLAAVCAAALLFAVLALRLPAATVPLALLWGVFVGAVFLTLMVLLQVLGSTPRGANMLITMVLLPLLMIGGNFFPFEAMPPWLAAIGRRTPNGWALAQLQAILAGTAQPGVLLAAFAALAAVGSLAFALSLRRMRRGFIGL
jgi:ABC-type multidrug transport system permease subunit